MAASRNLLAALLLCLFPPLVSHAATPVDPNVATVRVVLTSGDTLQARCVQPAPFDMVAVVGGDEATRYVSPVRIRAILDSDGRDRTTAVLEKRETLGVPFPPPVRVKAPPKPLRVGPRAVTKSFLITETSLLGRLDRHDNLRGVLGTYIGADLGEMINVSDHTAVGGGGFFGSSDEYVNAGVRLRLRRWLTNTASVELAPAVILAQGRVHGGDAVSPGFSVQASCSPSRFLTLTIEGFSVRRRDETFEDPRYRILGDTIRDTGVSAGIKLGQWPGAAAGALAALVAVAHGSTWGNSGSEFGTSGLR